MTEKTYIADPAPQPQSTAPTELRAVKDGWRAFREDLLRGAFDLQPLPPLPPETAWIERLPRGLRGVARRLPRITVLAIAFVVLMWSASHGGSDGQALLRACCAAGPVALLLLRPVGAFWLSLCSLLLSPWLDHGYGLASPYIAALVAHLTVVLFVAWRLPSRAAFPLWLLTTLIAALISPTGIAVSLFYCAALIAVLGIRAWRDSRHQVVAQSAAVSEERSRRMQLEERAVIARELHDVVAHHMSVVAIQAEAAPYRVPNPPEELVRALATIRENAVTALAELRRVLGVVRADLPVTPEAPQPTLAELPALVANVRSSGREAELVTTGKVRTLPPGVELSAYRIVQESLSNVLRHAPGAGARVELAYVLGGLGLRVANEPPADPSPVQSDGAGQGVRGMRERAGLLGGELTAGAREDGGWEVEAFLPVEPSTVPPEDDAAAGGAIDLVKPAAPTLPDTASEVC